MTKTGLRRYLDGTLVYHDHADDNWGRLAYLSGAWAAGSYEPEEVVYHQGGLWRCFATTTDEPTLASSFWGLLGLVPGSGNMILDVPAAGTDIGAGWTPVPFDTQVYTPLGCLLDTGASTFQILWPGIWEMIATLNLTHAESQQGRETNIRLFNVTQGAANPGIPIPIARNQPGTFQTAPARFVVSAGQEGDVYRLEIGGGDSITGINWGYTYLGLTQLYPG